MRTLGPGSVSSFLKVVLDVVYVALWIGLAGLVLSAAALLVLQPFAGGVLRLNLAGMHVASPLEGPAKAPILAALVLVVALYAAALVVIFNRLRRVFGALTLGDPFQPENVGRLRSIGLALIALELLGHIVHAAARWVEPQGAKPASVSIDLTSWFAILVVFVLAEVFREGARLRREAELTI